MVDRQISISGSESAAEKIEKTLRKINGASELMIFIFNDML
jgi:hypothetical protein